MVLLIDSNNLDRVLLKKAIKATFDRRGTHEVPSSFPEPPETWIAPFEKFAVEWGIVRNIKTSHFRRGVIINSSAKAQIRDFWLIAYLKYSIKLGRWVGLYSCT